MARIIYKPHCSECGALINDEIMYEKIKLDVFERYGFTKYIDDELTNIYPTKCKACGEYFDCIEITPPTNLTREREYDR